ncbi:hypothetical protein [Solidesulfovibrio sp.]
MTTSLSSLGTVGGPDFNPRTMSQAAVAAESQAFASSRGRNIKCNRGRGWMTTAECVANFRAGQDDPESQPACARDLGCSAGRMRAINFKEDDMGKGGRTNYGKCIDCGLTGNRDSGGRCYLAKCKASRASMGDPLEMRDSPILDDGEVEALDEAVGPDLGQGDVPANGQTVQRYGPDMLAALAADVPRERVGGVLNDAPSDPAAPFIVDGIALAPFNPCRQPARDPIVTIRSTCMAFSVAAVRAFDLTRFKSVRLFFGPDMIGLEFFPEHVRGCLAVIQSHPESMSLVVNAQAFVRHFKLKGRSGVLSEPVPGRFVIRLVGVQQ